MRINIDHTIYRNTSPNDVEEIIDNVRSIMYEVYNIKGWTFGFDNLRVSLNEAVSTSSSHNDTPSLWVDITWAAGRGKHVSPASFRTVFISKATKNRPAAKQNVFTYHSYSDLLSQWRAGTLATIVR